MAQGESVCKALGSIPAIAKKYNNVKKEDSHEEINRFCYLLSSYLYPRHCTVFIPHI